MRTGQSLSGRDGDACCCLRGPTASNVLFVPGRSEKNHRLREKTLSRQAIPGIGIFFEPTDQHRGGTGLVPLQKFYLGRKAATIGGFAHEIRRVRNYVHPGEWARGRPKPLKFTKRVYGVVDELVDVANSWLLHRLEKSLLGAMSREKKPSRNGAPTSP